MPGADKSWEKKVICWKTEATEGTDPVPVSPTDALKVLNFKPTFMDAESKVRALEKGFFGANPVVLTSFKRGASFDMEVHGGGVAGGTTVPPWMKVLRAAGFDAGVVTGGTSVIQKPISDSIISATMWSYLDDLLLKSIGGRASVGFTFETNEYPLFHVAYMGLAPTTLATQAAPASVAAPSGYVDPVLASTGNTTFTWDGYAVGLRRCEMNTNADLQYRALINLADRMAYRQRNLNGTFLVQIPDLTTKDYFANIRAGATAAASLVHGIVAGNIVTVAWPALQITGNVDISDDGGKCMASFPVTALPVAGNDEISFTTT